MNFLHDLPAGTADLMNVIVEIPRGTKNKYEIDKATGLIKLDRVNHTAQAYPFDYGFVPRTLWADGDALDVVLVTSEPLFPGLLVEARPVAIMHMVDSGEADEKIIAVPAGDPRYAHVKDLADVNQHLLREMEHFFLTYKQLQNKTVEINGFEGSTAAKAAFEQAVKQYEEAK